MTATALNGWSEDCLNFVVRGGAMAHCDGMFDCWGQRKGRDWYRFTKGACTEFAGYDIYIIHGSFALLTWLPCAERGTARGEMKI